MKNFLVNFSFFILGLMLISFVIYLGDLHTYILPNNDVYQALKRSKDVHKDDELLIIGDSVGKQLFNDLNENDTITSLACNQAIDFIGQYILLKNYLANNQTVKKVYMVYNPFGFVNNLDHLYSYNYFLKPFYNEEYYDEFNETVKDQIEKIPFHKIATFPSVAVTFWSPVYQPNYKEEEKDIRLSEITVDYLDKIVKLSESKNVEFELVPPPLRLSDKSNVEKSKSEVIKASHQPELFQNYYDKIMYLPDSSFSDRLHLKKPDHYRDIVISQTF